MSENITAQHRAVGNGGCGGGGVGVLLIKAKLRKTTATRVSLPKRGERQSP